MGRPDRQPGVVRRVPLREHRAHLALAALLALCAGVALLLMFALSVPHGALADASSPAIPHVATDTPVASPGVTPDATSTVGASATPTKSGATPTRPPARSGSGGGGSSGPEPTKVTFAQPTVGASSNADQAFAPSSIGSSGLTIATIMSCVTGVIGLIILITAFRVLVRDGYGPFLRALFAGMPKGTGVAGGRGRYAGRSRGTANDEPRARVPESRSVRPRGQSGHR